MLKKIKPLGSGGSMALVQYGVGPITQLLHLSRSDFLIKTFEKNVSKQEWTVQMIKTTFLVITIFGNSSITIHSHCIVSIILKGEMLFNQFKLLLKYIYHICNWWMALVFSTPQIAKTAFLATTNVAVFICIFQHSQ